MMRSGQGPVKSASARLPCVDLGDGRADGIVGEDGDSRPRFEPERVARPDAEAPPTPRFVTSTQPSERNVVTDGNAPVPSP